MVAIKQVIPSMRHLNADVLGALCIKTTGLDCKKHDLIQIGLIIADDYMDVYRKVSPFYIKLIPRYLEDAAFNKPDAHDALKHGIDYYQAADGFDIWFERLGLLRDKRIQLIGHNIEWQLGFIREWLGETATAKYFDFRTRDTGIAARFLNDRAYFNHVDYPVSKTHPLSYMASSLGVANDQKGDCLHDAICCLETYRRLVGHKV